MSKSRSSNAKSMNKILPPSGVQVIGTVCKILQLENQPVHAVLLSFTMDVNRKKHTFQGMLRRTAVVGSGVCQPGAVDQVAQARINLLKKGATITVMTGASRVHPRGYVLVDLSEKELFNAAREWVVDKVVAGTICGKTAEYLTVDLGGALRGRLPRTAVAAECQLGRMCSLNIGDAVTVRVINIEPDLSKLGEFHLILAEEAPVAIAA